MIGRLRGTLAEKQPPYILLDVGGVGYELEVPLATLGRLPALGEPVTLHTHLVVREDAQLLYAFSARRERDLFRELLRLNGVGPKLALALLCMDVEELILCVQQQNAAALTRVPGVGKKTAERLLVELKDRLKGWENLATPTLPLMGYQSGLAPEPDAERDAISALLALGFKPQEASRAVAAVSEPGLSSEALIRRALKGMHS